MKLAGFTKNSFIDYPEQISAMVFTSGCNMDCWYCHNRQEMEQEAVTEEEVFTYLKRRKGMLDALVVSGGEPTLQPDLARFLSEVKALGYKTKLDTNGLLPDRLEQVLRLQLVDYVAMDIKAPLEKYSEYVRKGDSAKEDSAKGEIAANVLRSIGIVRTLAPDYEFRTTFVPELSVGDIEQIAKQIEGAKIYYIQQYTYKNLNPSIAGYKPYQHPPEVLKAAAAAAEKYLPTRVRGI